MPTAPAKSPLRYTGDEAADRLLAEDPLALLIGMVLDQQVPIEKAFRGPYDLRERIGHLDARRIARMDPARLEEAFRTRPALHRFPTSMAKRVQELCRVVTDDYGGDPARLWTAAPDAATLATRLRALPGFGEPKVRTLISILAKRLGIQPSGWEAQAASPMSLGDVDSSQALARYREVKRQRKAAAAAKPLRRVRKER